MRRVIAFVQLLPARAVPPLHWRNMPHDSLLHTNDRRKFYLSPQCL